MRTLLTLATFAITGLAGMAYASDQAQDKKADRAVSVEQLKAGMDRIGYDVQRIERDDGAYEVYLVDRASSGKVKAHFDTKTGELTRAELADVDRGIEERDDVGAHKEHHEDRD